MNALLAILVFVLGAVVGWLYGEHTKELTQEELMK